MSLMLLLSTSDAMYGYLVSSNALEPDLLLVLRSVRNRDFCRTNDVAKDMAQDTRLSQIVHEFLALRLTLLEKISIVKDFLRGHALLFQKSI